MTKREVTSQALLLPESERLALAEELWASVEDPNAFATRAAIPQWQQDLLAERIQESENDPGKPWDQVKAEIWPKAR